MSRESATGSVRGLPSAVMSLFTAIADRRYDREELEWIEKIERHRKELASSNEVLHYFDFGAGSPDHQRSDEEMYEGTQGSNTVGAITRVASKERMWASVLFRIIREIKPQRCLEMGSSVGISGAYQAAALEVNRSGSLLALEGAESIAAVARRTLESLGLATRATVRVGRFQDLLSDALADRFDYVFVDGHHDGPATVKYFSDIVDAVESHAVVVFDDITWSPSMQDAWTECTHRPEVTASFDLGPVGVCLVGDERAVRNAVRCRIDLR